MKIKLSSAQNRAMMQIWELGEGVYGEKNVRPSASDMMSVSLKTLHSLAGMGLIESKYLHGAMTFPRVCIVWNLTVNGKLYCKDAAELVESVAYVTDVIDVGCVDG